MGYHLRFEICMYIIFFFLRDLQPFPNLYINPQEPTHPTDR